MQVFLRVFQSIIHIKRSSTVSNRNSVLKIMDDIHIEPNFKPDQGTLLFVR